jgi:predicted esterase
MKIRRTTIVVLSSLGLASGLYGSAIAAPRVEIKPLPAGPRPDATLPIVPDSDRAWKSARPLFELAHAESELRARGRVALGSTGLHFDIDVEDNINVNTGAESSIWGGDMLRVSLDGWGDGSRGLPISVHGPFGADDRSFTFALTDRGPVGWDNTANKPLSNFSITRNETKKITHYEGTLDWSLVSTLPGALSTFGLAITVRDADEQGSRTAPLLHWGPGGGSLSAGQFKRIAYGKGVAHPEQFGAFRTQTTLWSTNDAVVGWAFASGTNEAKIVVDSGSEHVEHLIKKGAPASERLLRVSVIPDATQALSDVRIRVLDQEGAVRGEDVLVPRQPSRDLEAVVARVDALLATATHPLWKRHLMSIKALSIDEWARTQIYREADMTRAEETAGHLETIRKGLSGDAAEWKTYLDGKRSLIIAFVSKHDKSLQQYVLTLPKAYDPKLSSEKQKPQPLFLELHGAGNDHKLGNAATIVSATGAFSGLGYDPRKPYAQTARKGVHIAPFGRGNLGYAGVAEIDIWEAYDDAVQYFNIDEDRKYLYGFSMGGSGTWRLGTRTPDRWAAMAILGMSPKNPEWGLANNIGYGIPVFVWSGEYDEFAFRGYAGLVADLKAANVTLVTRQEPKIGHNYLQEVQKETYEWLLTHKRKRPDRFSFVADMDEHRGVWGIQMLRALHVSAVPRFTCEIKGNQVAITAQGTPELTVDLGTKGLRLKGKVTVTLNGRKVFEGDVEKQKQALVVPVDAHGG